MVISTVELLGIYKDESSDFGFYEVYDSVSKYYECRFTNGKISRHKTKLLHNSKVLFLMSEYNLKKVA
jgi:hypothetical protein